MRSVTANLTSNGVYTDWLHLQGLEIIDIIIPATGGLSGVVSLEKSFDSGVTTYVQEWYRVSASPRVDPIESWFEAGSITGCLVRLGIINATDYYSAGSAAVMLIAY